MQPTELTKDILPVFLFIIEVKVFEIAPVAEPEEACKLGVCASRQLLVTGSDIVGENLDNKMNQKGMQDSQSKHNKPSDSIVRTFGLDQARPE